MKEKLKTFSKDSLLHNSFFLILATGVVAGLGFVFWLIAVRIFSSQDIGLATTLISVMSMIGLLSLLGFDVAFIRFLPMSKQRDKKISTGLFIVGGVATLSALLFLLLIPSFAPSLHFIREGIVAPILFICSCVFTALSLLTDAVFVAMRKAHYTFFVGIINWCVRLILPLACMHMGALGLFISFGFSQFIACIVGILLLIWKFDYHPLMTINTDVLKRMGSYSVINYLGGICNLLPTTLLPIIILNHLGPDQAAFYYIAMLFGNLLYAIPWSITRALFAEGAHDEKTLVTNSIRSAKMIALFLTPAMLVYLFAGDLILHLFGKQYSAEGFMFLRILAISGIAVSACAILGSFFRVTKDARWLILINGAYAVTVITLSYMLLSYELVGIGIAWLCGNIVAAIVSLFALSIARNTVYSDHVSEEEVLHF